MAEFQYQYGDLPQIPQNMDESRNLAWGSEYYTYVQPSKQHIASFSFEGELCYDDYDSGMVSIQPLDRFMQDQYPLSQGVLHAKFPVQSQLDVHHGLQWPSTDIFRHHSPSSNSSDSSYTSPNELHSPHTFHAIPYKSSTDMLSLPFLSYHIVEDFKDGGYDSNPSLAASNVNLRQLEYEPQESELEPAMDDLDSVDLNEEPVCDHEHVTVESAGSSPVSAKEYADSGIGMSRSVRDAESVQPIDYIPEDPESDADYTPKAKPNKRRRSSTSSSNASKVSKRSASSASSQSKSSSSSSTRAPKRACRASSTTTKKASKPDDVHRRFPCIFAGHGCESKFPSKNEWKRHVSTQHIKLSFWRCDLCPPTTDPNDNGAVYYNEFNRKDLFAQHLRRMHAAPKDARAHSHHDFPVTEDNLAEHQTRCLKPLRKAPQESACLFCEATFEGKMAWEECMEHVGRHLEKDQSRRRDMLDVKAWKRDEALEQYLLEEGLIVRDTGGWRIGDGKPRRAAMIEEEEEE
jgi:hypothetical protein